MTDSPHVLHMPALRGFVYQQASIGVIAGADLDGAVAVLKAGRIVPGPWVDPTEMSDEERQRWFIEEELPRMHMGAINGARVWGLTQLILSCAGNISKSLWPNPKRPKRLQETFPDRGERLRGHFGVADDSPLKDARLRNTFEHYDERIEEGVVDGTADGVWYDGFIADFHNISSDTHRSRSRTFATDTFRVAYLGEEFDLRTLIAAMAPIAARWPNG